MGTHRIIFHKAAVRYNTKGGALVLVSKDAASDSKLIKSQLVKRTSSDLKNSRVSAYSYLIP